MKLETNFGWDRVGLYFFFFFSNELLLGLCNISPFSTTSVFGLNIFLVGTSHFEANRDIWYSVLS